MGYITDIDKAFDLALFRFGRDNAIEIATSNIDMETDVFTPYLSGFQLPVPVEPADLGFNDLRQGVYQIDINYASHLGSLPLNEMADLLNETFNTGTTLEFGLVCVIIDSFSPSNVTVSNGWGMMNCTINWACYTQIL